jgi:hypothetical protein
LPDAVNKDQQMKKVQYPDDQKPQPIPPPPSGGSAQPPPSQLINVSDVRGMN